MSEAVYFLKFGLSFLIFLTFLLHFMLDSHPLRFRNRCRNRNRNAFRFRYGKKLRFLRFRFRLANTGRNLNSLIYFATWNISWLPDLATCAEHCTLLVRKWRGSKSNPGLFIHTFDRVRAPQSEWMNHRRGMRRAGTGWMSAKPEVEGILLLLLFTIFRWRPENFLEPLNLIHNFARSQSPIRLYF